MTFCLLLGLPAQAQVKVGAIGEASRMNTVPSAVA